MLRILKLAATAIVLSACMAGCGGSSASSDSAEQAPTTSITGGGNEYRPAPTSVRPVPGPTLPPTINAHGQLPMQAPRDLHPVVTIKTSQGEITVTLDREKAPLTVDNFLDYVSRGHYDQTVFHYVDDGYMIAGGGFNADLSPKAPRAEILNEANNGLKNRRYTIAMARNPELKDSATSQFYINLADNPSLDYVSDEDASTFGYCVFGVVSQGQDVVDRIAKTPVHDVEAFVKTPVEPVVIQTIARRDD